MKKVCKKLFSIAIILAIVIGVFTPIAALLVLSSGMLGDTEFIKTLTKDLFYWIASMSLWIFIITIVVLGYGVVKGELRKLMNKED